MLLSIVIPTLNSGTVIGPNLDSLLPQAQNHEDVEVLVINNGSTDDTQRVLEKYYQDYPGVFRCITREKTISAEENFQDGVHQSCGEYVLLLGDDDILSPSFLDTVLPLLDGKIGLFHYNRIIGENSFRCNSLQRTYMKSTECIVYYNSFSDFIHNHMAEYNFMSSIVFKRTVWDLGEKYVTLDKPYYGYYWYATITFGAVGFPAAYYYFPLVIQRVRTHEWGRMWPLYWCVSMPNIFKDLDNHVSGIYKKWLEREHSVHHKGYLSILSAVVVDQKFYRSKSSEFYTHLTKAEKSLFWVLTHFPVILAKVISHTILFFVR